jgi:cobalamin biosynthetic protein CobC
MGGEGIWHGGDLDEARALFPGAPEPWVDLSTGINPVPYPLPALPSRLFERLPAPADHAALEQAAAAAYGVADPATVVAAPGTQILISLLPRLAPPGPVAVLGPTYAEHARAWSLPDLHAHLGRAGIWTRRFQHDSSRLRFGLPGAAEAWERLERALAEFG